METEISDADRIAGNADVLSSVETEIVSLEQMFAGLESLEQEKARLTAAVQTLTAEEARTLGDNAAESVIVKKLTEVRGRLDVQKARLASIQEKIAGHRSDLVVQGETVRRAFAFVVAQLLMARQARATAILTELFGGPFIRLRTGRIQTKELTDHMSLMRQLRDVDNRLRIPAGDLQLEWATLQQQSRNWLAEVRDLVTNEPGLVLRNVPAKRQPIEQPRELAAV